MSGDSKIKKITIEITLDSFEELTLNGILHVLDFMKLERKSTKTKCLEVLKQANQVRFEISI